MSWTPDIMIIKKDYDKVKDKIEIYEIQNEGYCIAKFKFKVLDTDFIILSGGTTQPCSDIHDIVSNFKHYLIDGHCADCDNCVEWKYEDE